MQSINLKYLDGCPSAGPMGVRFGVPWPRSVYGKDDSLVLRTASGQTVPSQAQPIGYWPDGGVKWTAIDAVLDPGCGDHFMLERNGVATHDGPSLTCREDEQSIEVSSGSLKISVGRSGRHLIREIRREDVQLGRNVQLICVREQRSEVDGDQNATRRRFIGDIQQANVEQAGPVSLVIRLDGTHLHPATGETWLPFVVRLYMYAGVEAIRLVHSFVFDGDAEKDFIAGLGVAAEVPLRDPAYNRRVFLAGDDPGVWSEPVCPVPVMRPRDEIVEGTPMSINPDRARQMANEPLDQPGGVDATPVWQHFALIQDSPDHFLIRKSCGRRFTYIDGRHGRRALGTAAIADTKGGLAIGVRDFWQMHPSALVIDDAGCDRASVTAWLWPGYTHTPAMDLRHYSDKMHGPMYECHNCMNWEAGPVDPTKSNALGVARTNELMLWALPPGVQRRDINALARDCSVPPTLVCEPEHYHRTGVFGAWSLPARKHPRLEKVEAQLDQILDHYLAEVERQKWYGFWDWGDVMHSYDQDRHVWFYDEGGCAWDNIECSTDIWLWVSFLRTGRADVYRMAEAMARHVSDVDIHHLGPWAGLGSRHNVVHWGCSCKEPRISMPGGRRFYYFLTANERMADVFDEVCDAWPAETTEVVVAPTWSALCWNWVTAWERTGEPGYREKLLKGMAGVLSCEPPFVAGAVFRFDPHDASLTFVKDQGYGYYMTLPFGGPEIFMEMAELLEHSTWAEALAGYGKFWALPSEDRMRLAPHGAASGDRVDASRLIAFAARSTGDQAMANQAWQLLLNAGLVLQDATHPDTGETVRDIVLPQGRGQTNAAAQWSLNVVEVLALVGPPGETFNRDPA